MSLELTRTELRGLLQRDEGQFLKFESLWDRSGTRPKVLNRLHQAGAGRGAHDVRRSVLGVKAT